jgi:hypothetical protein
MKKLILIIGFCSFLITNYSYSNTGYIPPIRTMIIPYAPDPVIIDGYDCEAYWSAEQTTDAFNITGCINYPDSDFTFTFKVCYNENYLYIFGNILDDINNSTPDQGHINPWTFDNSEIFIDLDTNGSGIEEAYDTNTIQLRINRGMDSVQTPGRAKRSEYNFIWKNNSAGWVFEVAIPWKAVLGKKQTSEDILPYFTLPSGFDMDGVDSDGSGPDLRDCQTEWDNDDLEPSDIPEDPRFNNRGIFGVVTFQKKEYAEENNSDPCHTDLAKQFHDDPASTFILIPDYSGNSLTLEKNIADSDIRIFNLLGQTILTAHAQTNRFDISLSDFQKGNIYLVSVTNKKGNTMVKKFYW